MKSVDTPCLWCAPGPCHCPVSASTYTLPLPWSRPPLTANQRLHWAARARLTRDVRETVAWACRAAHVPAGVHADVTLTWRPPDRRRRDADNLVPTLKACCDGLVDAGIVPDDTPAWMTKHMPILGEPARPAELTLTVTVTPPAIPEPRQGEHS